MGKPEKAVEERLRDGVKAAGGKAYKMQSPGNNGLPDRLVCFSGRVYFVELKAPGGRLSDIQGRRIDELRSFGMRVYVLRSRDEVDKFLLEMIEGEAR